MAGRRADHRGRIEDRAVLGTFEGELWGIGADYKARFVPDRATFFPALGPGTDGHRPVSFTTLSLGRGADQRSVDSAAPVAVDEDVRYDRGAGISEHFAVRMEGVELSYRFESKPEGTGDLVVRIQVETDLELDGPLAEDGAFALTEAGVGGVNVGAVTGVDANGRTVAGATRYEDGVLELSLPAGFVEEAAYPMVLDPIIESQLVVASGFYEVDPDVAYDESSDTFIVVWLRRLSGSDAAIYARRYDSDGNSKGTTILALEHGEPLVANMAIRDQFVVVWKTWNKVKCLSVDAVTGDKSSVVEIYDESIYVSSLDISGEATHEDDDVIVVWTINDDDDQTRVHAAQVQVALDGTPIVFGSKVLDIAGDDEYFDHIAISKGGGAAGRHLVVWGGSELRGMVIDRDTIKLDEIVIESWGTLSEVDGDGDEWLVAYSEDGDRILGRRLIWDESADAVFMDGQFTIFEELDRGVYQPQVCTLGNQYLVAFLLLDPLELTLHQPYQLWMCTVDAAAGTALTTTRLDSIPTHHDQYNNERPAVASRQSADSGPGVDPTGAEVMIVWGEEDNHHLPYEGKGRLLATRYGLAAGGLIDLGGGSGGGGKSVAFLGPDSLTCELEGALPFAPTVLMASAELAAVTPFLPPLLAVDPINAMIVFNGTCNATGGAVGELSLVGAPAGTTLYLQWATSAIPSTPGQLTSSSAATSPARAGAKVPKLAGPPKVLGRHPVLQRDPARPELSSRRTRGSASGRRRRPAPEPRARLPGRGLRDYGVISDRPLVAAYPSGPPGSGIQPCR